MKAIAYYRSRPSEPGASNVALERQRAAVQRMVDDDGLDVVGEYVEREGEAGSERHPAYIAAIEAALVLKEDPAMLDVALIIASHAAIGSGEPFNEPAVEGANGLFYVVLGEPSVPHATEIPIPVNAPSHLCLYADLRRKQLDTLIYLCNAGPTAITDVEVAIDNISMSQFFSLVGDERWAKVDRTEEKRLGAVSAGGCVQVNTLYHRVWDEVYRYRLRFTDSEGRHWVTDCHDMTLSVCELMENPDEVWVAFAPARPADEETRNASA